MKDGYRRAEKKTVDGNVEGCQACVGRSNRKEWVNISFSKLQPYNCICAEKTVDDDDNVKEAIEKSW